MIKVKLYGHIRGALGGELIINCEELKVEELFRTLPVQERLGFKISFENTLVLVNGVEVSALNGPETVVKSGDEVALIPVTHGG